MAYRTRRSSSRRTGGYSARGRTRRSTRTAARSGRRTSGRRRSSTGRQQRLVIEVVQPGLVQRPDLGIAAQEAPQPRQRRF